jgi:hypothetical protein
MPPKTTASLTRSQQARLEATGRRVSEIIDLGLSVAEDMGAAVSAAGVQAGPVSAADCKHPLARRDRKSGLCNACGTNVGTGGKP